MAWLFFRLGDAKWQHCSTRWMLVTSSSDISVLDTSNGDVYVRRTRDYPIPPFAWHESHRNSSTIAWDMQWWRYGREKCAFVGTTVQRRPKVCENKPKEPRPCTIQWSQRTPKEAFAAAMQSWRQRCKNCVRLQSDYVEKWQHFKLPRMSNLF